MKGPSGLWMFTTFTLTGPWHVASGDSSWHVTNMLDGRTKKIGPVTGKGINYCDRARDEARKRNEQFFAEHKDDLPTFLGINPKFDEILSLVMKNTDKTLTAQGLFDKARSF